MRNAEIKFLIPIKVKKIILKKKTRDNILKLSKQQRVLMYILLRNKHLNYKKAKILVREYKKLPRYSKQMLGGYKFNKNIEKIIRYLNKYPAYKEINKKRGGNYF